MEQILVGFGTIASRSPSKTSQISMLRTFHFATLRSLTVFSRKRCSIVQIYAIPNSFELSSWIRTSPSVKQRDIMQSVMFRNNVWLDLTFAHIDFVRSAFLDTKATRVNLTGSLMIDRHFDEMNSIEDSILPNGTFYQMDETNLLVLNDNCTNSALISDFDYVEPHVNSTTRSCFFRSRVKNAVLHFGIETMSHSFLIQSGQAAYEFMVRVLSTKEGINATVAFIMGSLTERYRAGKIRFQYRCIPEFDFLVCFMDTPCRIHGMIPSNLAMLTLQVLFLDAQAEVDNIDFRIRQSLRISHQSA